MNNRGEIFARVAIIKRMFYSRSIVNVHLLLFLSQDDLLLKKGDGHNHDKNIDMRDLIPLEVEC